MLCQFQFILNVFGWRKMSEFCLVDEMLDTQELHSGSIGLFDKKKVKEFIKLIEDDIEDAQEDYANLDWISKDQALEIIKKRAGKELLNNIHQTKQTVQTGSEDEPLLNEINSGSEHGVKTGDNFPKKELKQILEKYKHLQLQPLVNELKELVDEK